MKQIIFITLMGLFLAVPNAFARTVKLGGDTINGITYNNFSTGAAGLNAGYQEGKECSSDSNCTNSQKCSAGKCVELCHFSTCTGYTPECYQETPHTVSCICNDASCPNGQRCNGTLCISCSNGEKCGCLDDQVSDGSGSCRA